MHNYRQLSSGLPQCSDFRAEPRTTFISVAGTAKGVENMRSKTDRVICGTCEYWTGKRAPVFDKNGGPKVDIFDARGDCMNVNSRFDGKPRQRVSSCCKHSKWTEIL